MNPSAKKRELTFSRRDFYKLRELGQLDEKFVNDQVYTLVTEKIVTLHELDTYWTLTDFYGILENLNNKAQERGL